MYSKINKIDINPNKTLKEALKEIDKINWVKNNTAILVVHGIGNQLPLETLDQFGRGLIKEYQQEFGNEFSVHHCIETKGNENDVWFDNVLRLKKEGSDFHIDLYEYYWANYTENKATWNDITDWLDGVVAGAKKFYTRNEELGKQYEDKSPFFNSSTHQFKGWKYNVFINLLPRFLMFLFGLFQIFIYLVALIPYFGNFLKNFFQNYTKKGLGALANIIGDITIYNVVDPKSKFYCIRRQILDGAVSALKFLIEKEDSKKALAYPSIIVAGHSLGSQVAYDAVNRINLYINQGLITNYSKDAVCITDTKRKICNQLKGFVTFGSPLDKIAFFLREHVDEKEYVRQWLVTAYHGFKQRNWYNGLQFTGYHYCLNRYLDDIPWFNYYDSGDQVSGSLDYYLGVTNIKCELNQIKRDNKEKVSSFTHSDYWECSPFYRHVIASLLT